MMRKYHEFIDYLVDKKRFEISLSFVSNGTIIDKSLIDKLKLFRNVDIEISIETMDKSNDYIRQGSTIEKMRANLQNIIAQQDDKLQIVLRTVPQLLSISRYVEVVRYAWENKIVIESIPLTQPAFMRIDVLPWNFRQQYVADLELLRDEIASEITFNSVLNGRSKGTLPMKLSGQCDAMIEMLQAPTNRNAEKLRRELVKHCQFWDKEYDLKIDDYLTELASMFKEWGYGL
jgi:MoaA/NifB/PqqE/SkfB family radical SAM enzyme